MTDDTQKQVAETVARFSSYEIMWSLDGYEPKPSADGLWVRLTDYEALAARLEEVEAERDALERQILRDRPLHRNTMDDATMWRFSVDMGNQTSTVVKIWEQRKEANARAEAAEARVTELEAEIASLRAGMTVWGAALRRIGNQKMTTELETEYEAEIADFESAHDLMIEEARSAIRTLAAPQPAATKETKDE